MATSKIVILTKHHYKIPAAAKILGIVYVNFYQQVVKNNIAINVNGLKFLTAEVVQALFAKYRPFDECKIDYNYHQDKPEIY